VSIFRCGAYTKEAVVSQYAHRYWSVAMQVSASELFRTPL
jgi:hypothetical protein